ncbi:MAG: UPF0158 family protein [Anaerolineae bacterium]
MQDEWMALARDEEALWWLDKETGEWVSVSPRDWDQASRFPLDDLTTSLGTGVDLARRIQSAPARFQRVPLSAEQELADARAFVPTVLSSVVQRRLEGVLEAPRAMERFRALLARHPDELARWQSFRAARLKTRMEEWLREEGLHRQ